MGKWTNTGVNLPAIDFDGDRISVSVKRLRMEDMSLMSKNFDTVTKTMRFSDPMEMCQLASKILPNYVVAFSGYKKGDGAEMLLDEFLQEAVSEFYFVPLVGQIFAGLLSVSTVPKDLEKNLPPPSLE